MMHLMAWQITSYNNDNIYKLLKKCIVVPIIIKTSLTSNVDDIDKLFYI
jgi:hypothetical protein